MTSHDYTQRRKILRRSLKDALCKLRDNRCERCGEKYDSHILDFHHLDPTTKEFELSVHNLTDQPWPRVLDEAAKCRMVCSNCHRQIHQEEADADTNSRHRDGRAAAQLSKCHCLAIKEMSADGVELYADVAGYRPIAEGLSRLSGADVIVMHNGFGFDVPAIVQLYGRSAINGTQVYDTLVASRYFAPQRRSHSLAALGEELGYDKGDHDDWSTFSRAMAEYCARDVKVTEKVFEKLWTGKIERGLKLEFDFAKVIALQEQHGFRLDIEKAQALVSEFRQEQYDIERQLQEVWTPKTIERTSEKTGRRLKDKIEVFNPGSRKQIADRLIENYCWKPKQYTPSASRRSMKACWVV